MQQYAEAGFELMVVGELFEKLFREIGDVLGVRFVELVLAAKIECRASHLPGKIIAPLVAGGNFTQQYRRPRALQLWSCVPDSRRHSAHVTGIQCHTIRIS